MLLASLGVTPCRRPPWWSRPTAVLRNPTVGEFAANLGARFVPTSPRTCSTWWWSAPAPPGWPQACTAPPKASTRCVIDRGRCRWTGGGEQPHRELLRLPQRRLSGSELVERGALQAQRLGAHDQRTVRVPARSRSAGYHFVARRSATDDEVACRAVIIATRRAYRKLDVDRARTVRERRCVLRGDRPRGPGVRPAATSW